jgi:hypothetical protein
MLNDGWALFHCVAPIVGSLGCIENARLQCLCCVQKRSQTAFASSKASSEHRLTLIAD